MNHPLSILRVGAACLAGACAGVIAATPEASYPDRPVRVVVPYTPGGATDAISRLITDRVSRDTKWVLIVENRPGGSGNIGIDVVAKAKADGYMLGMGQTANLAINPALFGSKMPYQPLKDLVPVAIVASQPVVMIVRGDSPWNSLADVIEAARAKPGEVKQALAATGTLGHMAGELLAVRAGFKALNVPYKGAAPALNDLMGGLTDYMFATPQAILPMVKSGKLKALAVTSSKRLPVMPDVPTVAESGYKDFEALDWKAVVAPAGTPGAVVKKLNAAIDRSLADPKTIAHLLGEGSTPVGGSSEAAAKYIHSELTQWATVIKQANIKLD